MWVISSCLVFGVFEEVGTGLSCSHDCLGCTDDIICKETVRVNLLVTDSELLLVLHLQGEDILLPIPKLEKMSLMLLTLATKYMGKLRLQLMTRRR